MTCGLEQLDIKNILLSGEQQKMLLFIEINVPSFTFVFFLDVIKNEIVQLLVKV